MGSNSIAVVRRLPIILLLLVSFSTSASADMVENSIPFIVAIEQDGYFLDIVDDTAYLEKAPFSLLLALEMGDSVKVNVSPSSRAFEIATGGGSIAETLETDGRWMGGAEAPNNARNFVDIKTDETSWQGWFLEEDYNSFNWVSPQSDFYFCTRLVENFTVEFTDLAPIEELPVDELFIVLVDLEISDDYTVFTERRSVVFHLVFATQPRRNK